jgi:hypothetical protein
MFLLGNSAEHFRAGTAEALKACLAKQSQFLDFA